MKEIKVRGIVIREEPMGDKDKRIVLLTEEMGKLPVLAKGALTSKSRFGALTQLFSLGDFVLTKGKTFYYIKEAQLVENFYGLREDLERLGYATFMAEVAETFSLEGQENRDLVRLFLRGLLVQQASEEGKASKAADAFVFRTLSDGGYFPDLRTCRSCGRSLEVLEEDESARFDFSLGSLICRNCSKGGIRLHSGALRALRFITEAPAAKIYSFDVTPEVLMEMDDVVTGYLAEQTERRYRGLEFVDKLHQTE